MKELKITDLVGLGSVSAFLLTIVFVYGYSVAIGYNLFAYFSLNDYFRLAIQWLPPLLCGFFIGELLHNFCARVEGVATEDKTAKASHPRLMRAFRTSADYGPFVILAVLAVAYTIMVFFMKVRHAELYLLWMVAGPFAWMVLIGWYAKTPKLVAHWSEAGRTFITLFPGLVIMAFFFGMYHGHRGSQLIGRDFEVSVVLEGQQEPYPGRILFVLDEFLVTRERHSDQLTLVPREKVKRIVHDE